ncbi:sensor histidine kinase [Ruminiclostridium papyrosolvens]|uniref:sensor histidine kinase n=1 Tax=Ruminiclostridium papyrosolvens TaxID=29362 RepID=UPI00041E8EB0|nr:HAMP domain-containing sensor histidine kinase [Ruminiclostridium papyrosolvens]
MIKNQQVQLLKIEKVKNQTLETAMKMKDEFLATITHEFKTPLTVINAALQAIESIYGSQISENIKRHLQRIRTNSYRQLRLVNNLLDITRYNAGHVKLNKKNLDIIFLSRAIVKSVDLYAKQKGLELLFTADCNYLELGIDEEKFERILLNLLSNAIKFTPKGKGNI